MSYEGYYQCICENGHRFDYDVHNEENCECGAKTVFSNSVDQTNGYEEGYVSDEDWEKFRISSPDVTPPIYNIPTDEEIESLRTYIIESKLDSEDVRVYCKNGKLVITSFGEYVKQARENLNLSKRELARRAKISPSFVIQIEKNKKPLPERFWDQYIEVLKLDRQKMEMLSKKRR